MKLFKNIALIATLLVGAAQAEEHTPFQLHMGKVNYLHEVMGLSYNISGFSYVNGKPTDTYEIAFSKKTVSDTIKTLKNTYRNVVVYQPSMTNKNAIRTWQMTENDWLQHRIHKAFEKMAERNPHVAFILVCPGFIEDIISCASSVHYYVDGQLKFDAYYDDHMLGGLGEIKSYIGESQLKPK